MTMKQISDADDILKLVNSFQGNLYSSRALKPELECLDYLKDINAPMLTTDQCETCEGKLSLNEIYRPVSGMSQTGP